MELYTGEMHQALVRELCSGRQLAETLEDKREIEAAKVAQQARGHKSIEGLGKQIGEIPQDTFFQILRSQGEGCWQDRGFVREFFNKHSHLRSHRI